MRHSPAALATPPLTLRLGGYIGTEGVTPLQVPYVDSHAVGISIPGLGGVNVEAGGEEQQRLAAGCLQSLINVGGDARTPGKCSQGGRFQNSEVPVVASNPQHRLSGFHLGAVVHGVYFKIFSRVDEAASSVMKSGAEPEHRQRLVHAGNDRKRRPAGEVLHLHFDVADVDACHVHAFSGKFSTGPLKPITTLGQGAKDKGAVVEVAIGVPALPDAHRVELHDVCGQPLLINNRHALCPHGIVSQMSRSACHASLTL